ncbi:AaceriAFR233Wp [[Ashbya] aceris (nom. inval.)]|nr:AaceriAFR233Wp [[Ashbya] aceris (nom. inval.)]
MAATTEELFTRSSIAEVRDTKLQLSQQLARSREQLNQQLQASYGEILHVCGQVTELYQASREVDGQFMDLCFNDPDYKLGQLQEVWQEDVARGFRLSSGPRGIEESLQNTEELLELSQWSASIAAFQRSPEPGTLEPLLEHFRVVAARTQARAALVSRGCRELEAFLVEGVPRALGTNLYIDLYETLEAFPHHDFGASVLTAILDCLLVDHREVLADKSRQVQLFIKRPEFVAGIREKLRRDLDAELSRCRAACARTDEPEFSPYDCNAMDSDTARFVYDLVYYDKGLITAARVEVAECIDNAIAMLTELKNFETDDAVLDHLRDNWRLLVRKELDDHPPLADPPAMADVVNDIVAACTTDRYRSLLEDKLRLLE